MLFISTALIGLSILSTASATWVHGQATGFATGTTGGGNARPRIPRDIHELSSWLSDSIPRVIVIEREYNFIGSEGTVTATGCRPASNTCPGRGQDAINGANWCTNGLAGMAPRVSVTYDQAGLNGINLGPNKTLLGKGANAVIRGKGLRIANGAKNIIIQNIHITDLNPQYIWGGDAITLAGTDLIWIDHVKFSLIGRQMFVAGYAPSNRVTISNSEFDGITPWSASCDGRHYWTMLLLGGNDQITLDSNYIHHTSGRGPKIGGNTLVHAVNNYWYSVSGHAFDNEATGKVLAEGNVFEDVAQAIKPNAAPGQLFSSPNPAANMRCKSDMRRMCRLNMNINSGPFTGFATGVLGGMQGKHVPSAYRASSVKTSVLANAGVGKI